MNWGRTEGCACVPVPLCHYTGLATAGGESLWQQTNMHPGASLTEGCRLNLVPSPPTPPGRHWNSQGACTSCRAFGLARSLACSPQCAPVIGLKVSAGISQQILSGHAPHQAPASLLPSSIAPPSHSCHKTCILPASSSIPLSIGPFPSTHSALPALPLHTLPDLT